MKKIITLLLLLVMGCVLNSFAQITKNPIINRTKAKDAEIIEVLLTPNKTNVTIKLSDDCEKVKIKRKCHIEYLNPKNGLLESKKLRRLYNIDGEELSLNYNQVPSDVLILEFPRLPLGINKINIVEKGDWKWFGVNINPRIESQIEKRIAYTIKELDSLITDTKSPYAGVYEQLNYLGKGPYIKQLAYVEKNDSIYLVYASRDVPMGTWKCGEIISILHPTSLNYLFKADWFFAPEEEAYHALISFEDGLMKVHFDNLDLLYGKIQGYYVDNNGWDLSKSAKEEWSGTGFALRNGYIVTNNHVIDGATEIEIFGVNGDLSIGRKAILIGMDKSCDLALLKIDNEDIISSWSEPPYSIKTDISDVGENVFSLGYPLVSSMGEEVKLTNGIISARSGFAGDVTNYQISVPIQPGNSGGPMFDENGCLVGIISSKHKGTENVGYAIKTLYLMNLIESVSDKSILPQKNLLKGKPMKEQVKCIGNSVYLIKCKK